MKMPAMSRRSALAVTAMVVGLAVIALALVGGSGSSGGGAASSKDKAIEPVAPIDPEDKVARDLGDDDDEVIDPMDPFAKSFGVKVKHKVTVRVSANGTVFVKTRYRGGKSSQRAVTGSYSATSTIKGASPIASVAIQLPPNLPGAASSARCRIVVDGIEVADKTTTESGSVTVCVG